MGHTLHTHKDGNVERIASDETPFDIAEDLKAWWLSRAQTEVEPLIAKMQEYGGMARATDLEEIGRQMEAAGVTVPEGLDLDARNEYLQELGMYFYLVGKFARWTAAVKEGRMVSDDTLLDIGIYVRMCQRARNAGGWPCA